MRKHFFAGLIILLPLVITYWIIKFILRVITGPFQNFATSILEYIGAPHEGLLADALGTVLILFGLVAIILAIGAMGRWMVVHYLFHFLDYLLHALPFVNKIYLSCKDFTTALFSPKSDSFSQVVLVPFPSANHRSIGLVTSEFKNQVMDDRTDDFISVLIPGTPNPTVGFLLLFSKKQLTFTDMRVDEAIKYVMSCGSVLPDSISPEKLIGK